MPCLFFKTLMKGKNMVWGAIAAAAGSIAGSALDKNSAKKAAKKQFQYNKALQQMNIDWEKEQHLNNHQWEIQDLEKAGLNPILSVGGSSAGSITGASQSTSPGNVQTDFGSKMSQLMQMKQMNSASKLQDQQADLAQQQGKLAQSQANKTDKEAGWIDQQAQSEIKQKNSASAKMVAEADYNRALVDLADTQKDVNSAKAQLIKTQDKYTKGQKGYVKGSIIHAGEKGTKKTLKWLKEGYDQGYNDGFTNWEWFGK